MRFKSLVDLLLQSQVPNKQGAKLRTACTADVKASWGCAPDDSVQCCLTSSIRSIRIKSFCFSSLPFWPCPGKTLEATVTRCIHYLCTCHCRTFSTASMWRRRVPSLKLALARRASSWRQARDATHDGISRIGSPHFGSLLKDSSNLHLRRLPSLDFLFPRLSFRRQSMRWTQTSEWLNGFGCKLNSARKGGGLGHPSGLRFLAISTAAEFGRLKPEERGGALPGVPCNSDLRSVASGIGVIWRALVPLSLHPHLVSAGLPAKAWWNSSLGLQLWRGVAACGECSEVRSEQGCAEEDFHGHSPWI